jgi:hypothetical protein
LERVTFHLADVRDRAGSLDDQSSNRFADMKLTAISLAKTAAK